MFDLNAVINAAINEAYASKLREMHEAYANKMGEMAQAISVLQDRLQGVEGVNRQMLSTLNENSEELQRRAGHVHGLELRLDAQVEAAQSASNELDSLQVRLDSLENIAFDVNGNPRSRKSLDEDDVRGIVATLFEEEGEDLIEDAFETLVDRQDVVTKENLEEKVREVMENASITLSVS